MPTCSGSLRRPPEVLWIPAGSRRVVVASDALPGRVLPGSPPHPQGGQGEGAEEYGDSDDQQVQQAFGDHAVDEGAGDVGEVLVGVLA